MSDPFVDNQLAIVSACGDSPLLCNRSFSKLSTLISQRVYISKQYLGWNT